MLLMIVAGVVPATAQSYAVELPYTSERGHIFVIARVGGIEGRYLFDTGAPTVITHGRAAQGHAGVVSTVEGTDANGQATQEMQVVDVGDVMLENFEIKGVQAVVTEEGNPLETMLGVDGIIGFNLFQHSVLRFDSRRKVIVIASGVESFDINPRAAIPMQSAGGYTIFDINLGQGIAEPVMFDTGAGGLLALRSDTWARLEGSPAAEVVARLYGFDSAGAAGVAEASEHLRLKLPSVRIGLGKFANVVATTGDSPFSLLGSQLPDYGYVTVDFARGLFFFEPFSTDTVDMYSPDWDITPVVVEGKVVVGMRWDSADPRITVGDRVLELGGVRLNGADAWQLISAGLRLPDEAQTTIVVRNAAGKKIKATMHRR